MNLKSRLRALVFSLALLLACTPISPAAATHRTAVARKSKVEPPPCGTAASVGYPTLNGGAVGSVMIYRGRLKMWPPNDNTSACNVRQIIFNVPDTMLDGLGASSQDAPVLQATIEAAQPVGPGTMPVVYQITRTQNGTGLIEYLINAEAPDMLVGDYFANITIIGKPKGGTEQNHP